jgi:hypothetical protein
MLAERRRLGSYARPVHPIAVAALAGAKAGRRLRQYAGPSTLHIHVHPVAVVHPGVPRIAPVRPPLTQPTLAPGTLPVVTGSPQV